jgi:transposase
MARRFRRVDRDQPFLLPPDMREWLPAGHLAWFVIDVVESLEVSRFAARVTPRGSAAGRAAFDPRVLLGVLVYGYATGVRSSRRIERACLEDVAFRVICAQDGPDHATIARFRREHFADPEAMGDLFTQVLVLAARAGLGKLGLIALDGTKIAANASREASRGERRLRELARQIVADAEAVDAAEDELWGDARGDELPPELADPVTRRDRIARALADLEAERKAAQAAQEQQASEYLDRHRRGRGGRAPRGARVAAAQAQLDREISRYQAKTAARHARVEAARQDGRSGLPGQPPVPASEYCRVKAAAAQLARAQAADGAPAAQAAAGAPDAAAGDGEAPKGPKRNVSDPDSRLMPLRGGGFIQGYNAQAMHSADGLCLATMVTRDTTDYASLTPMIAKAETASAVLRAHARGPLRRKKARIGTLLADAGYCSEANLGCPGPDRLIATGKRRDVEDAAAGAAPGPPAGGRGGDLAAAMAARLADPQGILAYRRRSPLAEGPFGDIKHNRGFRRLSMRGLARANGEWAFQNTAGNLLKIHATGWQPSLA